jgi:hypothetical protein
MGVFVLDRISIWKVIVLQAGSESSDTGREVKVVRYMTVLCLKLL